MHPIRKLLGSLLLLAVAAPAALTAPTAAAAQEAPRAHPVPQMFRTADVCMGCHNGMMTPAGQDISIGVDWRASMMANSARDPYWQAAVRREMIDHPEASAAIQNECSTCHMPMAAYRAHAGGGQSTVFGHLPVGGTPAGNAPSRADLLAADGVSCTMCHQIGPEKLGTEESFVGGFVVDDSTTAGRAIYGPFAVDAGRSQMMHSSTGFVPEQADHVGSSELCATCHTLYTHAMNDEGEVVGELPEQVPYLEWKHSAYPDRGTSCQDCHMPVVEDSVPVTGVLGRPRAEVNRHVFRGGNFFVLRMLARYAGELGVAAPARELAASARETVDHLGARSARLSVTTAALEGDTLEAEVAIHNLAGHKLPTAYPSRRAWLHVTVRDRNGEVVFESGAFREDGSIAGNDNDEDGSTYEPHHEVVSSADQVQVYEAIMEDWRGEVTTGLVSAVRYVKDSRLLPEGFDKSTAGEDVAVQGAAGQDDDFVAGGDRTRFRVDVAGEDGPFRVQAELWYQPIAYRWAHNLDAYDAMETDRFSRYYRAMSASSAVVLARGAATAEEGGGRADAGASAAD